MRSVRPFFIATFAITWGLGILFTLFLDEVEAVFGPMGYTNPSSFSRSTRPASSASSWCGGTTAAPAWSAPLQRRFPPLYAALILGVVSAVWHLPAFLLSGTKQSSWAVAHFFVGIVVISVILTPMFNAAGGSLLIAALFHAQMNGPAWPDAQPWDMVGFVVVAVAVVWVNRATMRHGRDSHPDA
ncbi:MAG: hypothetical protein LH603_21790 [Pseudonocardia sp.]|nr:hypothetical protein [Pseudonocardia sp.]